jgi:hypothetical protein
MGFPEYKAELPTFGVVWFEILLMGRFTGEESDCEKAIHLSHYVS